MRTVRISSLILLLLTAVPVFSTTYVVPDDRELVSAARAIVSGTVVSTRVRRGARIETVTEVAVEEWLKGFGARRVPVVLPGGQLGDERLTVPGVPRFRVGDRVLLFLVRNGRGDWTTLSFGLGAFVARDGLLVREEIFGWDVGGGRHVESARLERPFVDAVRSGVWSAATSVAAVDAERQLALPQSTYSASSYAFNVREIPIRRNGAVGEWRTSGEAGDLNIGHAADVGVAAWTAITPAFHDTRGPVATGDTDGDDGEWRIITNDPHNDIPSVCCFGIIAGTFLIDKETHVYNGETFRTLTHADILLNDGISSASFTQEQLDDIVTHEIGHTLGLRHADRNSANDNVCPAGSNCCVYTNDGGNCESVMASVENPKITGLHQWDRDAIACLYEGNCTTTCNAPSFLEAPQRALVLQNTPAILRARVRGTPPLDVKWYAGERGDTSALVDTDAWSVQVIPQQTTKYWVRVTDACGQIDSDAVEITVLRCPKVKIVEASATIVAPGKVRLRVLAGAADRYRWFRSPGPGQPGVLVGLFEDITVSYSPGATFWVRAANGCGESVLSEVLTPSDTPPPARPRRVRH